MITPTSVEAERVFSAAGLFLIKLRTRMGDQTLDKLIFLRFHFCHCQKILILIRTVNSNNSN